MMAFTCDLMISPQAVFPALAFLRLGMVFGVIGIATCVIEKVRTRRPILGLTREMRPAAVLAVWAIVGVPFSYWPGGSVSVLIELYLKVLAIFWLLCNTVTNLKRLRRVIWSLSLMSLPSALTAIDQYRSGTFIHNTNRIAGYLAPLSMQPNDLALLLNIILPFTVALLLNTHRRDIRLFLGATAILQVVAIVLTFSRSGFVGLVTIAGIYCWKFWSRPQRRWIVAAIVAAILCAPLLPADYLARVGTSISMEGDATDDPELTSARASSQIRWTGMMASLRVIMQHPILGVGIGSDILALNEEIGPQGPRWYHVHNAYLQYGTDLGIPGLVFFLMLLIGSIRAVRPAADPASSPSFARELSLLVEGIHVSLLALAVLLLFAPVAYHFYLYYIAGLAIAAKGVYQTMTQGPGRTHSASLQEVA